MTKRYYYKNLHHALLMILDFDMKIQSEDGCNISSNFLLRMMIDGGILSNDKLYIHPDSEYLLDPQVGDLVFNFAWQSEFMIKNDNDLLAVNNANKAGVRYRIIQRNGLPFMWPEVEDV